jgi:hypothetical protein
MALSSLGAIDLAKAFAVERIVGRDRLFTLNERSVAPYRFLKFRMLVTSEPRH